MSEVLGRCDKKQYEHCGLHPQYVDIGQHLPPFACVNWKEVDVISPPQPCEDSSHFQVRCELDCPFPLPEGHLISNHPTTTTPPADAEGVLAAEADGQSSLLPCPFCKSRAVTKDGYPRALVRCVKCSARTMAVALAQAIEQWNTRSLDASKDAPKVYHCSCGAACTADEYIDHLFRGHDAMVTDASKEYVRGLKDLVTYCDSKQEQFLAKEKAALDSRDSQQQQDAAYWDGKETAMGEMVEYLESLISQHSEVKK